MNVNALLSATDLGDMVRLKSLISTGTSVNAQNSEGRTALMTAVDSPAQDSRAITQWLIENKADVNLQNENFKTALSIAYDTEDNEIIVMLLDAGAEIPYAAGAGNDGYENGGPIESMQMLIIAVNNDMQTSLMIDMMKLLLQN